MKLQKEIVEATESNLTIQKKQYVAAMVRARDDSQLTISELAELEHYESEGKYSSEESVHRVMEAL